MSTERLAAAGFAPEPTLACVTWTCALPDGSTIVLTGADERNDPTDDLTGACWVTHLADAFDSATERASLRAPTLDAALDWARARVTLTERARAVLATLTPSQRESVGWWWSRRHNAARSTEFACSGSKIAVCRALARKGLCRDVRTGGLGQMVTRPTDLGREVARLLAEGTDR